jgi:hypothetical protein
LATSPSQQKPFPKAFPKVKKRMTRKEEMEERDKDEGTKGGGRLRN